MEKKDMSKKEGITLISIFGLVFIIFLLLVTSSTDKPVIYSLTGAFKTPASQNELVPVGADLKKWESEYAYKIVGEIKNFDKKKYQQLYPQDIVIAHKEGAYTLYTKGLPDPNFFHEGFIVVNGQ